MILLFLACNEFTFEEADVVLAGANNCLLSLTMASGAAVHGTATDDSLSFDGSFLSGTLAGATDQGWTGSVTLQTEALQTTSYSGVTQYGFPVTVDFVAVTHLDRTFSATASGAIRLTDDDSSNAILSGTMTVVGEEEPVSFELESEFDWLTFQYSSEAGIGPYRFDVGTR